MRNYFAEWFERYRRRRQRQHADAVSVGYRFGDAPTSDEMAQLGRQALEGGMRIGAKQAPPVAPIHSDQERKPGQ